MDQRLNDFLDRHLDELLYLLSIDSTYDETTIDTDAPCGKGVKDALDYMRALAYKDGFFVSEYEGNALAVFRAEDVFKDRRIDVVSHLDVVEPGDGWTMPPFRPQVRNNAIYGRGSEDMKTPMFLTYLAFKLLDQEKTESKRQLRLVLGTDEERTMNDMIYYVEKEGKPDFAFTPDGAFPMAIGEKGSLMWRLSADYDGPVEELRAGVQCNVISPVAYARLETGSESRREGKAAHASNPDKGESATVALLEELKNQDKVMNCLYQVFRDPYGSALGYEQPHDMDHSLTLNLGILKIEDGKLYAEVDCRYPDGITSKELTKRMQEMLPALKVSLDYDSPPTMNDPEDPYVKTLLDVYYEKTGSDKKPFVSGGVSYSKIFGHCVAFGPIADVEESLAHQADEHMDLDQIRKAFEIYYESMKRLMEMPL
ncbi:MAG: M20/M25/M40 family metallo-hydrolase [Lachnospiraceae bacterium]|nr:M20/M25/M40 family metallo-hydrolase [Lachnospiraceae bacterium]